MKIKVTIKYPSKDSVEIDIPNKIAFVLDSIKFAFCEESTGMKSLDTFKSNIKLMMVSKGYISDEASLISINIFE